MAASTTDIRSNETTEETNSYFEVEFEPEPEFEPETETPTNQRVATELPSQLLLTEEITPRLRASWVDSPLRMRSVILFNRIDQFLERLGRGLWRMVMIGVLLHVAAHFAPELREQIPVLFNITDGAMVFVETIFRMGLRLISALFQGRLFEVTPGVNKEFAELLRQFGEWIASL